MSKPGNDAPLQKQIDDLRYQLKRLEDHGGFPDVKLLQRRFGFIEERLANVERLALATLETVQFMIEAETVHLVYRHGAKDLSDNKPDSISVRKARHRLSQLTAPRSPRTPEAAE